LSPSEFMYTRRSLNAATCVVLSLTLAGRTLPGRGAGEQSFRLIPTPPIIVPLEGIQGLTLIGTRARAAVYRGRKAVELTQLPGTDPNALESVALLDSLTFADGTIELWVAGTLAPDADSSDRAFIGLVFRSSADGSRFDNVYLRPTNGRADDQLRRNHSTQYEAEPDYPWYRLRKESPGQYESYVDLSAGAWTHLRVVVSGRHARLFVNDALQPCLVIDDLKSGASRGKIGLWIGSGTKGYFSHMVVTPAGTA
jgi:hypothetical protein